MDVPLVLPRPAPLLHSPLGRAQAAADYDNRTMMLIEPDAMR